MGNHVRKGIVTSGLILYLDAANPKSYGGSGTQWKDLSGNGYTATMFNNPPYSSVNAGSFSFNAINQYMTTSATSADSATGNFTFGGWAKYGGVSNPGSGQFLTRGRDGSGLGWSLHCSLGASGGVAVVTTSPSTNSFTAYGTTVFPTGTWAYVIGVWQAGVGLSCYVNGVLERFVSITSTTLRASTIGWSIGSINVGYFFSGNVGLIHVYNRALTAAEVQQNFEATKMRYHA